MNGLFRLFRDTLMVCSDHLFPIVFLIFDSGETIWGRGSNDDKNRLIAIM